LKSRQRQLRSRATSCSHHFADNGFTKNVNTQATRLVLAEERASCMKQFSAQIEIQEPMEK
jgi:hypothetical protein